MKIILDTLLVIFGLSLGLLFLPLVIGGFIAWYNISEGNIGTAFVAIVLGLGGQWLLFKLLSGGDFTMGSGGDDCPYCGSGDTDGNHCYTCDDDF